MVGVQTYHENACRINQKILSTQPLFGQSDDWLDMFKAVVVQNLNLENL